AVATAIGSVIGIQSCI
ncbi:smalltalk protein, partial [Phocaeicola dorei]